jgi:hypothetical protein
LQLIADTRTSSEKYNRFWGWFFSPDAPVELHVTSIGVLYRRSLYWRKWDELRWRWFGSYRHEFGGLKSVQIVLEATRMYVTNGAYLAARSYADSRLAALHLTPTYNSGSDPFDANPVQYLLLKAATRETCQNMTVTAIALKRYELRHHQLPATLADLTPDLLIAIPTDCMDGHPLRYRPNPDGTYLLYSVGLNGVDDGGNPVIKDLPISWYYDGRVNWQDHRAPDWVWPQPATEEQVRAYYQYLADRKY